MQLLEGSNSMRMKRFIGSALVAVLVLALAGIAVATGSKKQAATEPAAAEFTAAPVADKTKTRTCTGVDGQYNITHGTYKGTSTGDPRLTGDIVIKTKSIVNLDNGLGVTQGSVWLSKPAATTPKSRHGKKHRYQAVAKLQAVNTERGKLDGFLSGVAKNADGKGKVALAANFSATFNADGTSLTGQLGGDAPVAPTNSAVFYGRPCAPEPKNTQQGDDDGKDDDRRGNGHGDNDDRHDGRHNDDDKRD
jgi:hypothetical protein